MTQTQFNTATIDDHLETLLEVCSDAQGVLVATIDGNPISEKSKTNADFKRISAMASTLISLGDTLTEELNSGNCKNIILENERGIVVFMHINEDLILVSYGNNTKALGMLLSTSRLCADNIRSKI